jgi:hypothetical protein
MSGVNLGKSIFMMPPGGFCGVDDLLQQFRRLENHHPVPQTN